MSKRSKECSFKDFICTVHVRIRRCDLIQSYQIFLNKDTLRFNNSKYKQVRFKALQKFDLHLVRIKFAVKSLN